MRGTPRPPTVPHTSPPTPKKKEYNDIILKMFSCVLCANMAMQTLEPALKSTSAALAARAISSQHQEVTDTIKPKHLKVFKSHVVLADRRWLQI